MWQKKLKTQNMKKLKLGQNSRTQIMPQIEIWQISIYNDKKNYIRAF